MIEPFHEGEVAVQERAGERDLARRHGAGISSHIIEGALPFLARQRLLAVTAAGDDGHVWTSVWCGEPGFARSADGSQLDIVTAVIEGSPDDPVLARVAAGRDIGVLAIDLLTRRRLRVAGPIEAVSTNRIRVRVRQSVGNCPKYIHRHEYTGETSVPPSNGGDRQRGSVLDDERRDFLERATTAFVGSVHRVGGADASHRGGAPGFIKTVDATILRVPDYPGNSMFMTLGNFMVDSRASLAVLDFERGQIVSFSGSASVRFEKDSPAQPTGGTGRYWDLAVREWVQFGLPALKSWQPIDASPYNPAAPQK